MCRLRNFQNHERGQGLLASDDYINQLPLFFRQQYFEDFTIRFQRKLHKFGIKM